MFCLLDALLNYGPDLSIKSERRNKSKHSLWVCASGTERKSEASVTNRHLTKNGKTNYSSVLG